MLLVAFVAQDARAVTRAEIIEGYKVELRQAYNDPSLNPAVTALCKSVARSFTIFLEDTNNLDYDLDKKQNKYYVDTFTQLELDANVRGKVTWRIFRDACKAEVGYYQEPARWNRWSHDIWAAILTEQMKAEWTRKNAGIKECVESWLGHPIKSLDAPEAKHFIWSCNYSMNEREYEKNER